MGQHTTSERSYEAEEITRTSLWTKLKIPAFSLCERGYSIIAFILCRKSVAVTISGLNFNAYKLPFDMLSAATASSCYLAIRALPEALTTPLDRLVQNDRNINPSLEVVE
jgi:hypothetical protein